MNATIHSIPGPRIPTAPVDVIICGGGPVGLAMAYLLGRAGIASCLFEKRATTTALPKGQYVHAHTAELYRQWGVWERLEGRGWSVLRSNGQGVYVNVAAGTVAEVRQAGDSEEGYAKKWEKLAPVYPRKVPASDYEAAIFAQAAKWPGTQMSFSTRVVDVRPADDHVEVTVRNEVTGEEHDVRGRYLIACDGSHSFIRNRVGRGEDHGPAFVNQVLVEFQADLSETLGRDGFFHSFVIDPRYAGWFGSQHPDSGLWRYSFRHDEEDLPDESYLLSRIRGALGMPDIALELKQTFRFDYTTGLLRNWREGNVFFAGDAAHWHSPWGGFGANSGVQDANNLAWKLALVLKGLASEDLLATYETERKSKAYQTVKYATYNSLNYQAIVQSVTIGEPGIYTDGSLSAPALQFLRERIEPHGGNAVLHTGYQLGTVYTSGAVMPDGATAPVQHLVDYEESTVPGVRAPHVWLNNRDGERRSIVDFWGNRFVAVVPSKADVWRQACARISEERQIDVSVLHVADDGEWMPDREKFDRLYRGDDRCGMVLVRPDGYVARRFHGDAERSAYDFLAETFAHILGTPLPDARSTPAQAGSTHG